MKILSLILILLFNSTTFAAETCSRIAIVNYQEILVDPSSTSRGEGLRYYLQKDPKASELLDQYQKNNAPIWQTATLSTAGSVLLLGGILRPNTNNSGITSRSSLMLTGVTMMALSYLISRTIQYKNEYTLMRSIEEYNKRNIPRIYFNPFESGDTGSMGVGLGITKEF